MDEGRQKLREQRRRWQKRYLEKHPERMKIIAEQAKRWREKEPGTMARAPVAAEPVGGSDVLFKSTIGVAV